MKTALFLLLGAAGASGQHNQLSPQERSQGWHLLFDGTTFRNWQDPAQKKIPGNAWKIEDGCLTTVAKPNIEEDLLSSESFGDFELKFDWKVAPGGNTGLKYRLQHALFVQSAKMTGFKGKFEEQLQQAIVSADSDRATMQAGDKGFVYTIGFEFQLLDDERHPDAKNGTDRQTGSLYSMIPATVAGRKPAGEWNSSRLVVRGQRVEHWLNGIMVMEGDLTSEAVKAGVRKRWAPSPGIRMLLLDPMPDGPIALQHHGDPAWFRNIKVRRMDRIRVMSAITVRPAAAADAEFLVRGNAEMALETEHLSLDLDRLRSGVHALFEDTAKGVYWIAEIEGLPVGQMMITYEWSDWRNGTFWWIQSVYTLPAFRGHGVFKALYRHVDTLARQDGGVCGLRLYVEQENARAQATYERCGMHRTMYQMFEVDFVIHREPA